MFVVFAFTCRCVCLCFTGSLRGVKSPTLGWVAQIAVLEPVFDCTCTAPLVLKNACSLVRFEKANTNADSRRLKLSARLCPTARKVGKGKKERKQEEATRRKALAHFEQAHANEESPCAIPEYASEHITKTKRKQFNTRGRGCLVTCASSL